MLIFFDIFAKKKKHSILNSINNMSCTMACCKTSCTTCIQVNNDNSATCTHILSHSVSCDPIRCTLTKSRLFRSRAPLKLVNYSSLDQCQRALS